MIQKSVNKLLATSKSEPGHYGNISANSDSQSETSDVSMLSDAKSEHLDVASQDVKLGIHSLVTAIKVALDSTDNSSTSDSSRSSSANSTKRILPVSPADASNAVSPKHSSKQKKMRRSLSLVDMNEVL